MSRQQRQQMDRLFILVSLAINFEFRSQILLHMTKYVAVLERNEKCCDVMDLMRVNVN